jgi:pyruvate carboxylase subunit B
VSKKKVRFMCTAFRDGFQSVYGARVFTQDFLPALEAAKDAGINYFEAGGGARFQSLYFYCNEDAFAMMDAFRATAGPDADLQTLARGVNVVGLESQSSDIVKMHADLFKKHGISTIRNFDALNDVNNLIYSGQCIVDAGLKHQVCVTLMELPPGCEGAHDADFYERTLREILDAGIPFDAVCFKDASGTAVPSKVHETIKRARRMLPEDTFIHFHTHETAGIGVISNQAAIDAGADAIDLSMAPCSGGTCQPDIIVMWHALRGTDYDLDVDIDKVREAEEVFKDCMSDYFLPPEAVAVEPMIPWSPMPGGALTANTQMLRDNGIMDRYPDMIKAMREVVEKGGYGTSVTPVSQFYFQQAFNNVMFGPWKRIAEPYGQMVLGYFGKTPVPADAEVIKIASEQLKLEPTTQPPLERNDADPNKGVEAARKQLQEAGLEETDENIFIVSTCKAKGLDFLQGKGEVGVRKIEKKEATPAATAGPARYKVSVNGRDYSVAIDGDTATVDGRAYNVGMRPDTGEAAPAAAAGASGGGAPVKAEMPGKVIRLLVHIGDHVEAGEGVLVLEAMKMEMQITAPAAGTVTDIAVAAGDQVAAGDVLAHVG